MANVIQVNNLGPGPVSFLCGADITGSACLPPDAEMFGASFVDAEVPVPDAEISATTEIDCEISASIHPVDFEGFSGADIQTSLFLGDVVFEAQTDIICELFSELSPVKFRASTAAILESEIPFPDVSMEGGSRGFVNFEASLPVADFEGFSGVELSSSIPVPDFESLASTPIVASIQVQIKNIVPSVKMTGRQASSGVINAYIPVIEPTITATFGAVGGIHAILWGPRPQWSAISGPVATIDSAPRLNAGFTGTGGLLKLTEINVSIHCLCPVMTINNFMDGILRYDRDMVR